MIRVLLVSALLLGGCAGKRAAEPTLALDPFPQPNITPVTLQELRGRDVLIFPDIAPDETAQRLVEHLRRCRTGYGARVAYDPNGFRLVDPSGATRLSFMLAQVSRSSAVALDGPDFSPAVKEELAQAAQGRSECAAA